MKASSTCPEMKLTKMERILRTYWTIFPARLAHAGIQQRLRLPGEALLLRYGAEGNDQRERHAEDHPKDRDGLGNHRANHFAGAVVLQKGDQPRLDALSVDRQALDPTHQLRRGFLIRAHERLQVFQQAGELRKEHVQALDEVWNDRTLTRDPEPLKRLYEKGRADGKAIGDFLEREQSEITEAIPHGEQYIAKNAH